MIPIWRWQNAITERRADTITQQLETYQRQYGSYPESLAQLVPQYLPYVPTTANGLLQPPPFRYHVGAGDSNSHRSDESSLYYYAGTMVDATYSSRTQQWHFDD